MVCSNRIQVSSNKNDPNDLTLLSEFSERWTLPDRFYTVDSYLAGGMSQRIVMIDTVALTGIYGNGPPNDDVGNPPDPEYAKLMWKWIEKTLSEVDSKKRIFHDSH